MPRTLPHFGSEQKHCLRNKPPASDLVSVLSVPFALESKTRPGRAFALPGLLLVQLKLRAYDLAYLARKAARPIKPSPSKATVMPLSGAGRASTPAWKAK